MSSGIVVNVATILAVGSLDVDKEMPRWLIFATRVCPPGVNFDP
jgi:hypothetical protein